MTSPDNAAASAEPAATDAAQSLADRLRRRSLEAVVALLRPSLDALVADWRARGVAVEDQPAWRLTDEVLSRQPAQAAEDRHFLLECAGAAVHGWFVDQVRAVARTEAMPPGGVVARPLTLRAALAAPGPFLAAAAALEEQLRTQPEQARKHILTEYTAWTPAELEPLRGEPLPTPTRGKVWRYVIAAALAAGVLLVMLPLFFRQAARETGWTRDNLAGAGRLATPAAFYERLADLLEEGEAARNQNSNLPEREAEAVRDECLRLVAFLETEATPLPPDRQQELAARCQEWGTKFDELAQDVHARRETPRSLQRQIKEQFAALVRMLRERARQGQT